VVLPLMAATTKGRYEGIFQDYLKAAFGQCSLGEITPLAVQRYFSNSTKFPADLPKPAADLCGLLFLCRGLGAISKSPD